MNITNLMSCILVSTLLLTGCVSKKKFFGPDSEYTNTKAKLADCQSQLSATERQLRDLNKDLQEEVNRSELLAGSKDETIADLKAQSII